MTIGEVASELLFLLAGCAVAVAWHRVILLHEQQSTPAYFGINWRVAYYFGIAALMYGSTVALIMLGFVWTDAISTAFADQLAVIVPVAVLWVLLIVLMTYIPFRLILIFPALAIEDSAVSIRALWGMTRGNFWRLFAGAVCCIAPAIVVIILLETAHGYEFLEEQNPVRKIVESVFIFIADVIGVGFVSVAYRELSSAEESTA